MDGMILKVERAPEDSAFGNPLDANVQAADFIKYPPMWAVHDSSKSSPQHYAGEVMRANRHGFFTDTLLPYQHITCLRNMPMHRLTGTRMFCDVLEMLILPAYGSLNQ